MRARRAITALTIPVVALLGLSACQSDDAAAPASSASEGATAAATEDSGSAVLSAEDFVARTTAAITAAGSVQMAVTTTDATQSMQVNADLVFGGDAQKLRMTMDVEGVATEIRIVDGIQYVSLGEMTGGKFVAVDPASGTDPFGGAFDALIGEMDPTGGIADLEGAIRSIAPEGDPVELDGVQAQPYRLELDTAALQAAMAADGSTAETMPAEMSVVYWIGVDDDLIRKMSIDQDGSVVEMLYSGWGSDLTVVAPTAEEITTL
ncbi:LppX_LprAFG lipoprotein [Cellulomonas soli]|uniref:Lipoprotein n=1 Tax=Cellulomonas soli TaxID=931535 RepID=A0A512PHV5_9CELL|nr:LppX_LprAFG lipoprotein [Cellulomonas soli]NYI59284.1 hypothetical protein [Cellulomonas soli]GEP70789.1 hypothetical protein CSO01_35040 [Cellulomonas soli]